jgi:tRNA pseudouridine38-40 synthase
LKEFNYLLRIEYAGTNYFGWQKQKNVPTVQGILEECLRVILKEKIKLIGSGRTDAGVHALNQGANFISKREVEEDKLRYQINSFTPDDILVKEIKGVNIDFHARRSAIEREYQYFILNRRFSSAFFSRFSYLVPQGLDLGKMQEAAELILGEHNFYPFCFDVNKINETVREVTFIEVSKEQDWVIVKIRANSFLYKMVRNISGILVQIGKGEASSELFERMFKNKRKFSKYILPPDGLFLTDVRFKNFD